MSRNNRHTFNELREKLRGLSMKQKEELLSQYQAQYLIERGKEKSHSAGIQATFGTPHNCWVLRRCIAMIKTSMNMKGYHYNPR